MNGFGIGDDAAERLFQIGGNKLGRGRRCIRLARRDARLRYLTEIPTEFAFARKQWLPGQHHGAVLHLRSLSLERLPLRHGFQQREAGWRRSLKLCPLVKRLSDVRLAYPRVRQRAADGQHPQRCIQLQLHFRLMVRHVQAETRRFQQRIVAFAFLPPGDPDRHRFLIGGRFHEQPVVATLVAHLNRPGQFHAQRRAGFAQGAQRGKRQDSTLLATCLPVQFQQRDIRFHQQTVTGATSADRFAQLFFTHRQSPIRLPRSMRERLFSTHPYNE